MSSAATLEGVLSEIRKMREEQSSALAKLNAAPAPASSHTPPAPRRAKAAKGCSKGTVAAVLAAALAIVAAVFPSLYEMCPAMRAPPTAAPASASVVAAAASSTSPAAAAAELAAHKRNAVFLNAVAIDYFPFSSLYPDFTVKRLISATIHKIRAFPRACVFSAAEFVDWMRPTLDGGDRLLRRGLVHVEAVFLPLTGAAPVLASAASALAAFQTYQRALERYNSACHVHKLEPNRLDDDNAVVHLHLYHCSSEFLTMPAARVGTKDCRVKHWPNAPLSSFCRTGRDAVSAGGDIASHIPGFTSVSDEEEELEHDTNQVLDVLALPRRQRPSNLVMPPDDEIPGLYCDCDALVPKSVARSRVIFARSKHTLSFACPRPMPLPQNPCAKISRPRRISTRCSNPWWLLRSLNICSRRRRFRFLFADFSACTGHDFIIFTFANSHLQVLSVDPPVFLLEDFLSEDEVLHLHGLQDETMAPSGAVGASLKDSRHYRSSSTQFLDESGTPGAYRAAYSVDIKIHWCTPADETCMRVHPRVALTALVYFGICQTQSWSGSRSARWV